MNAAAAAAAGSAFGAAAGVVAGGIAAEIEYTQRYPAALVHHIKSTHITIPYASATGPNVLAFVMMVAGRSVTHDLVEHGRTKFEDVKAAIEAAQKHFKST